MIIFNNKKYVVADIILTNAPIYSKGVRTTRDLIRKKNIDEKYYIFARFMKNEWVITDGKSPKYDKVLK